MSVCGAQATFGPSHVHGQLSAEAHKALTQAFACDLPKDHEGDHQAHDNTGALLVWWERAPIKGVSVGPTFDNSRFCVCGAPRGHFGSSRCQPKPEFDLSPSKITVNKPTNEQMAAAECERLMRAFDGERMGIEPPLGEFYGRRLSTEIDRQREDREVLLSEDDEQAAQAEVLRRTTTDGPSDPDWAARVIARGGHLALFEVSLSPGVPDPSKGTYPFTVNAPDPRGEAVQAAERLLTYVGEFGDGEVDVQGQAVCHSRDIEMVARAVLEGR